MPGDVEERHRVGVSPSVGEDRRAAAPAQPPGSEPVEGMDHPSQAREGGGVRALGSAAMDQIYPRFVGDVDPEVLYAEDQREAWPDRPWVVSNMVSSVDGATAVGGRSSSLGGPGDLAVFRALRGVADLILVGAGTARAEDYGPVRLPSTIVERRVARGRAPVPRLAVVSGSLDFDLGARLFTADPIVITAEGANEGRRRELEAVVDLVVTPGERVDLTFAVAVLRRRGFDVVLAEGGPGINGQLAARGLLDELCLTIGPLLAGGDSRRILAGVESFDPPIPMRLDRVLVADGELLCRYLTRRDGADGGR